MVTGAAARATGYWVASLSVASTRFREPSSSVASAAASAAGPAVHSGPRERMLVVKVAATTLSTDQPYEGILNKGPRP